MPSPTLSSDWTWPVVTWLTTWWRSSLSEATLSPPLPSVRLSETSRRSSAMSPLTLSRKWPLLPPLLLLRSPTSFPTVRLSPLAMSVSDALRPSSSLLSWVWSPAASMRPPTTPSWSATLTSGRTCMPTQSSLEAPPCTLALPTECRRRSLPLPHQLWRSRSLLPLRGNTLSGLEAPSLLPSPPSNRCGSLSRSMTNLAHRSSTGSASKNPDRIWISKL